MNATDLSQILQKGFYVTLGATATLLEMLQDPTKREQNLSSLRQDIDSLAQELAEKGAVTEAEAKNFVDTLISRQINKNQPTSNYSGTSETSATNFTNMTVNTTASTVGEKSVPEDLKELTQQLADLRAELESIRQQNN
jgi:polyhydroxyalkanoate synthesis regulator phasin